MQRPLGVTLLPYVHFCHNLLISSYPNKGHSQEFVRITICLLKKHIMRMVDLGTAGPNPINCMAGAIGVYICLDKAQPSFHIESFHPVFHTPGVSLLFPLARRKTLFILPEHSWNHLILLTILVTAKLSPLLFSLSHGISFWLCFNADTSMSFSLLQFPDGFQSHLQNGQSGSQQTCSAQHQLPAEGYMIRTSIW